jgi:hypothetical protein
MAHPHNEHRVHKVEKRRVAHLTKHYAAGGAVHEDEVADKKLIKRAVKKTVLKVEGHKAKHRADRPHRARGGKVKGKKGTTVNIINAPGHAMGGAPGQVPGGAMPPAMPPRPPVAAAPPSMPGAPPASPAMMPPGAMPPRPGMPMPPQGMMPPRQQGGRAYAKGGAVKDGPAWKEGLRNGTQVQHDDGKMDQKNMNRGKPITYAKGGAVKGGGAGDLSSPRHGARKPHPESETKTGARLVQFYAGGKVEAPKGIAPATKLPGGSGGARARLAKEHRAERDYARAK